jgi:hypothetical protein
MTKRFARLALAGAAVAALALPAAPASAATCGTFAPQCDQILDAVKVGQICHDLGTFPICVP